MIIVRVIWVHEHIITMVMEHSHGCLKKYYLLCLRNWDICVIMDEIFVFSLTLRTSPDHSLLLKFSYRFVADSIKPDPIHPTLRTYWMIPFENLRMSDVHSLNFWIPSFLLSYTKIIYYLMKYFSLILRHVLTLPRLGGSKWPQHYIFAFKIQTVYTEKFKLLEFSQVSDSL